MNLAHLHLILNHIPIVSIPVTLLFLLKAMFQNDPQQRRFPLLILALTAATVLPVYLTGEPAEKVVEHISGVSEAAIEAHEEAAEFSLIVTLLTGVLASLALILPNWSKHSKLLLKAVVASTLVAMASLGYTANLGGKIRHSEISSKMNPQNAGTAPGESQSPPESNDNDNDD